MPIIEIILFLLLTLVILVVVSLLVLLWASSEIASLQRRLDRERTGFQPAQNDASSLPVIPQPQASRAH